MGSIPGLKPAAQHGRIPPSVLPCAMVVKSISGFVRDSVVRGRNTVARQPTRAIGRRARMRHGRDATTRHLEPARCAAVRRPRSAASCMSWLRRTAGTGTRTSASGARVGMAWTRARGKREPRRRITCPPATGGARSQPVAGGTEAPRRRVHTAARVDGVQQPGRARFVNLGDRRHIRVLIAEHRSPQRLQASLPSLRAQPEQPRHPHYPAGDRPRTSLINNPHDRAAHADSTTAHARPATPATSAAGLEPHAGISNPAVASRNGMRHTSALRCADDESQ